MTTTIHQVQYGDTTIEYHLDHAARKTLEISVHPDLSVTVVAPQEATLEAIEKKVQKRANWILRQQREFELYLPQTPPRQYISGETHRYLGKQYQLKVIQDADAEWVKLERGYLYARTIDKTDIARIQQLVEGWYMRQAQRVFQDRIRLVLPRFDKFDLPEFALRIKKLHAKWGSCASSGTITLNLKLMQVQKQYIDYVITHELCHLIEPNHSARFYCLLNQIMPGWKDQRQRLNRSSFD